MVYSGSIGMKWTKKEEAENTQPELLTVSDTQKKKEEDKVKGEKMEWSVSKCNLDTLEMTLHREIVMLNALITDLSDRIQSNHFEITLTQTQEAKIEAQLLRVEEKLFYLEKLLEWYNTHFDEIDKESALINIKVDDFNDRLTLIERSTEESRDTLTRLKEKADGIPTLTADVEELKNKLLKLENIPARLQQLEKKFNAHVDIHASLEDLQKTLETYNGIKAQLVRLDALESRINHKKDFQQEVKERFEEHDRKLILIGNGYKDLDAITLQHNDRLQAVEDDQPKILKLEAKTELLEATLNGSKAPMKVQTTVESNKEALSEQTGEGAEERKTDSVLGNDPLSSKVKNPEEPQKIKSEEIHKSLTEQTTLEETHGSVDVQTSMGEETETSSENKKRKSEGGGEEDDSQKKAVRKE